MQSMTTPVVIETTLRQEPVLHDTFIDDLAGAGEASPDAKLPGSGTEPPPSPRVR